MKKEWPFLILRIYGTGKKNERFLKQAFLANEKHPGLLEEFWFAGISSLRTNEENEKAINEILPFREACEKHGIAFSMQQGVTLNHGPDGKKRSHISEDAWAVDSSGKRLRGLFCPTSPEARAANLRVAELTLKKMRPVSYWPDDDLRVSVKTEFNCCCDRCIGLFNKRFKHKFTRKQLVAALKKDGTIRKEWTLSNARNLGEFSTVFREAVDKTMPECRLGLQSVYASEMYDGPDYYPILKAFAGPQNKKVGIRPGAGFYMDREPRGMFEKALDIQREAARCAKYGFVGQICFEAENWPHVGSEKNPYLQMQECALMLASGCDSLALYWGSDLNSEAPELSAFYFDALAEFKPYFLAIRDVFSGTSVSGMALYHGENYYSANGWTNKRSMTENRLMENAVPVTCTEVNPEMLVLNDRCVEELGTGDFEKCFSRTVLMDVASFRKLDEKFPKLKFTKMVSLINAAANPLNSEEPLAEVFENKNRALNFWTAIQPNDPAVKPFSKVSGLSGACGTCVIPTEFGGHIVLIQTLDFTFLWTGYRRKAVLDAIDSIKPLAVRLLTNGFSVSVTGRIDKKGKTVGAFLLNMSCGPTMPLRFAVRNPAFKEYYLYRFDAKPLKLKPFSQTKKEIVFELPPIPAWQSAMIAGK